MKQTSYFIFLESSHSAASAAKCSTINNCYATIYCQGVLTSYEQTRVHVCEALFKLNYDILCQELSYVNPEVDCVSTITAPLRPNKEHNLNKER